jgi:hypothetical protein
MKYTAHSFVLRQGNPQFHGKTCLKIEKPATLYILRQQRQIWKKDKVGFWAEGAA